MKHINIDIIIKRHCHFMKGKSHEGIIDAVQKITHVRLDREQLDSLEGIDLLGECVTHLYIQHNEIDNMKPLIDCCFNNLSLICLSNNQITKIIGVKQLKNLLLLDLSHNKIQEIAIDEIPKSIISLNLKDNPCTENYNYRKLILEALYKLKQLDCEQLEEDTNKNGSYFSRKESGNKKSLSEIRAEIEMRSQKRREQTSNEHNSRIESLDIFKTDEILSKSNKLKTARMSLSGDYD